MTAQRLITLPLTLVIAMLAACASTPDTPSERRSLEQSADATLAVMLQRDPALRNLLQASAGYVVFPEIVKGGFIVGGASGIGVLYERGRRTGTVKLQAASVGAQIGGQSFAELIVIRDPYEVTRLKADKFAIGADISAVALTSGAAASARFDGGIAVFVMPKGGLMADISVSGQRLDFEPAG